MKNPKTTTYLVSTTTGIDGTLLACLLAWCADQTDYDIRMSPTGNLSFALSDWQKTNTNIDNIPPQFTKGYSMLDIIDFYIKLDVKPESSLDYVFTLGTIDQEILDNIKLAENNIKVLAITFEPSDVKRMVIDQFFKTAINQPLNESNLYYQQYLNIKDTNEGIVHKNITRWRDLTNDEMKIIFNTIDINSIVMGSPLQRERFDRIWIDDVDKDNLFELAYNDLLTNKDIVMATVGKIIGKPITESMSRAYDKFITIQNRFHEKFIEE
jgi:hypothetical protein